MYTTSNVDSEAVIAPLVADGWTEQDHQLFETSTDLTPAQWLDLRFTHSSHAMLPERQSDPLRSALGAALAERGMTVTVDYTCLMLSARRTP